MTPYSTAPTARVTLGRALRVAVAAMAGFVFAAATVSLIWWGVEEPTTGEATDSATELLATLAPGASVNQAEVRYIDATRRGPAILRADTEPLDVTEVATRAGRADWSVEQVDQDTLLIDATLADAGRVRAEVRETSLEIDPHQSLWPLVAQALAGLLGGGVLILWTRKRMHQESRRQYRRRTAISTGLAPAIVVTTLLVVLTAVINPPGQFDSGSAVLGAVVFTWWLLLPLGAVLAVLLWTLTPAQAATRNIQRVNRDPS